jgi:hypothetical protein
MLAFKAF